MQDEQPRAYTQTNARMQCLTLRQTHLHAQIPNPYRPLILMYLQSSMGSSGGLMPSSEYFISIYAVVHNNDFLERQILLQINP